MARPNLTLGTAGRVKSTQLSAVQWVARCRYRDFDGVTRLVEKRGRTRGAAEQALARAIRDRSRGDAESVITPDTKLAAVARVWWGQLIESDLSPSTKQLYRDRLDKQILPALGNVRVRELSVGVVDRHLEAVKLKHGNSIAKTCKSVLSGICGLAARHDAIATNPVREVARISTKPRNAPHALSVEEVQQLRAALTYDDLAVIQGLPDLVAVLCATGMRIGEACAMSWADIDLDAGTIAIQGTVLRLRGKGLIINRPKSKAGVRTLELPAWCIEMLVKRYALQFVGRAVRMHFSAENLHPEIVFPTQLGNLRDPSNTRRDMRWAFRRIGYEGLTSHVFRKSVATLMDQSGRSARAIADQLGHAKPSLTQDVYMGRGIRVTGAAEDLQQLR